MNDQLPDDADGGALRRLERDGSDLSQPMEIDFAVDVPDAQAGQRFASVAGTIGFETAISEHEGRWTCNCTRTMTPTYDAFIEMQAQLDRAGTPFGARSDGWGTFGNGG